MSRGGGPDTDFSPTHLDWIPRAKFEQLQQIGPLTVYKVNGDFIRTWIFIDFTAGCNPQARPWMPPNEIWIDASCWAPNDESQFTLLHELHEYNLMCQKGWSYDKAHDSACVTEQKARRNPSQLAELLAAESAKAGAETSRNKISKSRLDTRIELK